MSYLSVPDYLGNLGQSVLSYWTALTVPAAVHHVACDGLTALSLEDATILSATRITAGVNISIPGSCQQSATPSVDACRVYGVINTTSESSVKFEMWLPDTWYGRFLAVGNGGLNGIYYPDIDYGTSMHFATIGSDNGHDGNNGLAFLNNPEVINDYAYRAIHVEAVIGKQVVEAYYNSTLSKSYFLGCSTGGRQALQSARLYPNDFDGLIGGAPAINFNNLNGWGGMLGRYTGAPHGDSSPNYISSSLWQIVAQEIMKQCDGLDGLEDGIISEPDDCHFDMQHLLCLNNGSTEGCLTQLQLETLSKIYSPLYGNDGQHLYPRFDPGAEMGSPYFRGFFFPYTTDWMKHAIYNDSELSFEEFGVSDVVYANTINPGGVATWNGNLSAFKNRGGKLLTFHGRQDSIIPSGISKLQYELIASTHSPETIDDFYRLFLIPGMAHCAGGPGAWAFGQRGGANKVNDTAHNMLLAMVDWVENGVAPSSMTGVGSDLKERVHCLYPRKSIWSGVEWACV